jgi:hypothetical protein
MSLKALFAREICIRLSDDLSGLVCTARLGRFRMKSSEFVIEDRQARLAESSHSYVVAEPIRPRYHLPRDNESEPR